MPEQILLSVGPPGTVRLWDGDHTKSGSGTIQGGKGTWSDAGLNFTDPTGTQSETGGGNTAVDVFGGNPGEVGVQGPVHVHEIQILTNNYTFYPLNDDSQFLANGPITIEVGSTYQVNISVPFTGDQTGTIIKDGDGILILSGDNRNVGSFVLNGGTLVADTLNALPNSVTLKDGLMRFGMTHILQVGSYTQHEDTILALRASRTNHDLLVVNGPANLGGTLLLLQEGKGKSSSLGRQITLITTQGLNGSRFDNIQLAHTSLEKLSVNYDANNVYVISHFDPIYPYAISHNAQALARNLDLFSNTDRNQSLFDSLAALSLPQVPAALEKLVPSQVSALSSIGLSVNRSQMRSLQGRLDDLNSGYASYGELNTSAPKQYGLSLAGISTQTNFLMNEDQDLWNFYMRGNGSFGRQSQDNENEIPGYDYGQGGTFIGADHPLNDKVYVGGAVSYTYTDASFHDDRGSLSTNSYFAHLYAAYAQPKGFNLISSLSLGDHEFDLRRRALTDTAHSQPQSREVDFQSQISYNIPLKPNLTVSPYAGLAYSAFWMNGFQEYNSEANLKINNDQTNWLRSTVGAKVQYEKSFTKGIRKASVETNLAWEHEYFNAQSRGIDAEWVGGGVPSFHVQGGRIAPDTLISGVNLRLAVTNLFSVITGYDIEANRDYISHNFNVGASLTF